MITIRSEQFRAFDRAVLSGIENDIVDHCYLFSPHHTRALTRQHILYGVQHAMLRAKLYGITGYAGQKLYTELSLLLGSFFDIDPVHHWASRILNSYAPETVKLRELYLATLNYQKTVDGENHVFLYRSLLMTRKIAESAPPSSWEVRDVVQMAKEIFPQKYEFIGESNFHMFASECLDSIRRAKFANPASMRLIFLMKFYFGSGCFNDPFHPWISASRSGRSLQVKAGKWLMTAMERIKG